MVAITAATISSEVFLALFEEQRNHAGSPLEPAETSLNAHSYRSCTTLIMTIHESKLGAVAAAIVGPPLITYLISSAMNEYGLDIFSIALIEAVGFATAVCMVKPRAWNVVSAGLLYFTAMTIFIVWIGHRTGYYVMSGQ